MGFTKFVDFLHLMAAIIWIGGMIYISFILMPRLKLVGPQERGKLMNAVGKAFSITAWVCIIILILTGLYKTPASLLFDVESRFGTMLLIKHILILIAIIAGLVIVFSVLPRMRKFAPMPGEKPATEFISAQKTLGILSVSNMIIGILIVILLKFV